MRGTLRRRKGELQYLRESRSGEQPVRKPRVGAEVVSSSFLKRILDRHTACFVPCSQTVGTKRLVCGEEGVASGTRMHFELCGSDAAGFTVTSGRK